ncbi:MAG: SDR family NAD(P)-dependent oxidoreductase [Streptosporangiaceae bacterium]
MPSLSPPAARGRIINTTSGTGLFGTVGRTNYGAAKAGIVSLTTITATGTGGLAAGASPAPARSQPRRPGGRVLGPRAGAARTHMR